jgi:ATP-binding cassette subfamily B protein
VGAIIDAAAGGAREELPGLLGRYAALIALFATCIYVFIRAAGVIASGVAHDLRRDGFAHLQRLGFAYYDRRAAGWLMARLTSDIGRIAGLAPWFILDLTWGPFYLCCISAMMLAIDAHLALLVMAVVPPLALVSLLFQRRLLGTQRRMRRTNSQITAAYNEGIMGVQTTQALAREAEALGEFSVLTRRMYRDAVRNGTTAALYLPVVLSIGSLGVGLALWRGGVTLGEGLSIGKLITFMTYAAMFSQPIQELAARFTDLQAAQASAERLLSMLDERPSISDPATPDPEPCAGSGGPIRSVEFRGVDFSYSRGEPVLSGFDLSIRAGESIALVGATGSGKTTIAGLLCRFYEPTAGQVLVDGIDLRERSQHWLQSRLGVVLQHPHLFPGTIRENIRYGRLEATDAQVEEAAHLAGAHECIAGLEKGYDTEVGEGGCLLSSGERQFVSLARAVLADPAIFVMDEATSSLDTETERRIQAGIDSILAGRISVIIAHRLSTVRRVDRILVIEKGRIIEEGSHAELMARRGAYHRLYMAQFARERGREIIEGSGRRTA